MQISDQAHVGSIPCPELISWPRETIRPLKERSGCRRGNHANGMRERSAQTRAKQLNLAKLYRHTLAHKVCQSVTVYIHRHTLAHFRFF